MIKVTKQYGTGAHADTGQNFTDRASAKRYVDQQLQAEAGQKIKYRILEWDEVVEEFDAQKVTPSSSHQGSSSGGQGKGASFRPSPLNTAPRPASVPHSSFTKDKDEDKDKK